MLHPSTKRLIDKLSDMTRKQRVTWTEGENATVVHDTEGYRVVLTPEPHSVLLTDVLGREILYETVVVSTPVLASARITREMSLVGSS